MATYKWPVSGGSGGGVSIYPTSSALPATATDGTLALTSDTDVLYVFNATDALWKVLSTPGSDITSINLQAQSTQTIVTDANGTDFGIVSAGGVHTFSLPVADAAHTGKLSAADWSTFNAKQPALGFTPVPNTRTVNTKPLTADIALTAADVGADASGLAAGVQTNLNTHTGLTTTAHGGIVPSTRTVNGKALSADISLTASDVGADASGAASTVQTNLNTHTGLTTTAHGGIKASTQVEDIAHGGTGQITAPLARSALGAGRAPNGLENGSAVAITYDPATRVFTLTITGTLSVWVNGVKYAKTGTLTTTAHSNLVAALYFCYFDSSGNLAVSATAWDLLSTAPVAAVYYNPSNAGNGNAADAILIDERHPGGDGTMSDWSHRYNHLTRGTQLQSGLAISGYTLNVNTLAGVTWGTTAATLEDEDLQITAAAVVDADGVGTPYRIFWKTGTEGSSVVWHWTSAALPFHHDGTNPYFNVNSVPGTPPTGAYSLSAISTNLWMNYWVLGTTAYNAPQTVVIMGENSYSSLALAQAATFANDVHDITLLTTEGVVAYRTTLHRVAGATTKNTQQADIQPVTQSIIGGGVSGAVTAASVSTDVTNFDGILSKISDTTDQKALDRLDDHTHTRMAKNYITDGDFSFPTAAGAALPGWTQYKNTAPSATPEVTPGGTPDAAFSFLSTSTTPLAGSYSALLTQTAANLQGNSWRYAFTLDRADLAKVVNISFDYEVASGTFADGDITVWISDGTNVIQPAPYIIQNAIGTAKWSASFQTSATATAYQLIIHRPNTTATAFTLKLDNIVVSRTQPVFGAPISDWTDFTPTSPWTNTTITGKYRRVGDSLEVVASANVNGAVGASALTFSIPSGYTIDVAKLAKGSATNSDSIGTWNGFRAGVAYHGGTAIYNNTTSVLLVVTGTATGVTSTSPATWATNDTIGVRFSVPIVGFSSSTQMSYSADTRVVAASYNTSNTSIANNGGTAKFTVKEFDTHGAYDTSTGLYTVPVTGIYRISSMASFASGASGIMAMDIVAGGVTKSGPAAGVADTGAQYRVSANILASLTAGQTVSVVPFQNSGSPIALNNVAANNYFHIERVTGPSQIAASETISARYYGCSSSINATPATITYSTKDFDTHGAYSAGTYTVPASGRYQINAMVQTLGTYSLNQTATISIYKNGNEVAMYVSPSGGAQSSATVLVSDTISCLSGDLITIRVASGATSPTINNNSTRDVFSITRLGL